MIFFRFFLILYLYFSKKSCILKLIITLQWGVVPFHSIPTLLGKEALL